MFQPRAVKVDKKFVSIPQQDFPKGYVSTLSDSRIPTDALAKMLNIWLEQDSVPRPRPPFVPYGQALVGTSLGQGTFMKLVSGLPQYWEISMQVVAGVANIYIRKDGGTWTIVTSGSPTYNTTAWCTFTPGAAINTSGTEDLRVYINNGVDDMSYYDITGNNIVQYAGLAAPASAPTLTVSSGLTGTNFTQYYAVTANGPGGESAPSAVGNHTILTERNYWTSTENIGLSWPAVSGATSYTLYTGDIANQLYFLATVSGVTFTDDGSIATNLYKLMPVADSSAGPSLPTLVNIDNQLFGCGDHNNPSYLWYSGQGYHFGDFSFNPQGGGYALIDYGGNTLPTVPFAFQDGKGNPVVSILTYGQAGFGKLLHFAMTSANVGSTVITYPNIYEASSKDGTPASRGVGLYNNQAYYCTGVAFKTTGIKPNVINILSTDTLSNQLLQDLPRINLGALSGACALEYLGKIYFALPVDGSTVNNTIWILDLTRGGLWILEWPVKVQHMWLYEDNSGGPHLLTLQNGVVLELDLLRLSTPTQDNGVAFQTTLRSGAMVFDKGGVAMFSSYITYLKFLYPLGQITATISGVDEDNPTESLTLVTDTLNAQANQEPLGYGQMTYSNPAANIPTTYSGNTGPLIESGSTLEVLAMEVSDIVNQQTWEITTTAVGCDYLLSSATTTGYEIPRLYSGQ